MQDVIGLAACGQGAGISAFFLASLVQAPACPSIAGTDALCNFSIKTVLQPDTLGVPRLGKQDMTLSVEPTCSNTLAVARMLIQLMLQGLAWHISVNPCRGPQGILHTLVLRAQDGKEVH